MRRFRLPTAFGVGVCSGGFVYPPCLVLVAVRVGFLRPSCAVVLFVRRVWFWSFALVLAVLRVRWFRFARRLVLVDPGQKLAVFK